MCAAATWRTGSRGHSIPIVTEAGSAAGKPKGYLGRRGNPSAPIVDALLKLFACVNAWQRSRAGMYGGRTGPGVHSRGGSADALSIQVRGSRHATHPTGAGCRV